MEQFKNHIASIESLEVITLIWHGLYYIYRQKDPGREKVEAWEKLQFVASKMQVLNTLQGIR